MVSEEAHMSAKTYKIISIVAAVVAVIGLISFVCGTRNVNVGSFIFPAIIAMWTFSRYWRERKKG